jgi:hypothetical protein
MIPTVKLHKDGATAVVNESDAAEWVAKGWATEQAAPPAQEPAPERPRRGRPPKEG